MVNPGKHDICIGRVARERSSSPWYRWYIFAVCAGMYILSHFWRVSNAVIAGDLSRDLGLSTEVLGLAGGAFFYAFGLLQLPMGPLLDRFGPRRVISLLALIGTTSAMIFALSGSGVVTVLSRAGIGVGMAAVLMGSYKIFTTWFSPHEFATLSGIMLAFGNMGAIYATTPLSCLSEALGWRAACGIMSAVTLLMTCGVYLVVRDHPPLRSGAPPHVVPSMAVVWLGMRTVFSKGAFWRVAPLGFATNGALMTAQGLWGGPYLMHGYGMSKAAASSILLAIPVGLVCGAPFWGRCSDKLMFRKPVILVGQVAMLLVFSSLALHLPLPRWGLVLQCWLLGFTASTAYVLYAQVKETFPLVIAGTALTSLNFFNMLGAAMFQQMTGIIMGQWQPTVTGALPVVAYQWGFGVSAVLLFFSLAVYAASIDTHPATH